MKLSITLITFLFVVGCNNNKERSQTESESTIVTSEIRYYFGEQVVVDSVTEEELTRNKMILKRSVANDKNLILEDFYGYEAIEQRLDLLSYKIKRCTSDEVKFNIKCTGLNTFLVTEKDDQYNGIRNYIETNSLATWDENLKSNLGDEGYLKGIGDVNDSLRYYTDITYSRNGVGLARFKTTLNSVSKAQYDSLLSKWSDGRL